MRIILSLIIFFFTYLQLQAGELVIFSGAGLMKPMEEFRQDFEKEHKIIVNVYYAGAAELFGMLSIGRDCDILIPGAEKYTHEALRNGWIIESTIRNLVYHIPVIAVPSGNPGKIKSLKNFANKDVKLALGDPKGPAIGRVAKQIFEKLNIYEQVKANTLVWTPTVNQLLIYINLRQVDAVIIWEDLATWSENKKKIEIIEIPEDQNTIKTIPAAITRQGYTKTSAREFNDYISSDSAAAVWKKWGFKTCPR